MKPMLTLKISPSRLEQLRQIAAIHDQSLEALVEDLIATSWGAHGNEAHAPLFDISGDRWDESGKPVVFFAAIGTLLVPLSLPEARRLMAGFNQLIQLRKTRFGMVSKFDSPQTEFVGSYRNGVFTLQVTMQVKGQRITKSHTMSPSVTRDLVMGLNYAISESKESAPTSSAGKRH